MTGHQIRQRRMYAAIAEAVLTNYGFVPVAVLQDMTAHAIQQTILHQAYEEHWIREQAAKASIGLGPVVDMIVTLQAPIGGRS